MTSRAEPATSHASRGLREVYIPGDQWRQREIDLVAVHGLDTNSPTTWQASAVEGDTSSRTVNWLQDPDMLPSIVPSARIATYDWDANTYDSATGEYLHQHAQLFLQQLASWRQKTEQKRPMAFIASCYGGLLVAKTLIIASTSQYKDRDIVDMTVGVIFLGTPFKGSNGTTAAQIRAMVACAITGNTSPTLLEVLNSRTGFLDDISHSFSQLARSDKHFIPITCIYETGRTFILQRMIPKRLVKLSITKTFSKKAGIVLVDQQSACLDGTEQVGLAVRHSMLNKYRGPNDLCYQVVSFHIKKMVERAGQTLRHRRRLQDLTWNDDATTLFDAVPASLDPSIAMVQMLISTATSVEKTRAAPFQSLVEDLSDLMANLGRLQRIASILTGPYLSEAQCLEFTAQTCLSRIRLLMEIPDAHLCVTTSRLADTLRQELVTAFDHDNRAKQLSSLVKATNNILARFTNQVNSKTFNQPSTRHQDVSLAQRSTWRRNMADFESLGASMQALQKRRAQFTNASTSNSVTFPPGVNDVYQVEADIASIYFQALHVHQSMALSIPPAINTPHLFLKDAHGSIVPLSLTLFDSQDEFQQILEIHFKRLPGLGKVRRQEYCLTDSTSGRDLDFQKLKATHQVNMYMIFEDTVPSDSEHISTCPVCSTENLKLVDPWFQVQCIQCCRLYQRMISIDDTLVEKSDRMTSEGWISPKNASSISSQESSLRSRSVDNDSGDDVHISEFKAVRVLGCSSSGSSNFSVHGSSTSKSSTAVQSEAVKNSGSEETHERKSEPRVYHPQLSTYSPGYVSGTPGNSERLDPRFKVHPSAVFVPGEVFKILWYEPKGYFGCGPPGGGSAISDVLRIKDHAAQYFVGFRRFIIIANDEGHCTCVPVLTYDRQGCNQKGTKPKKHGIIVEEGVKPKLLKKEPTLGFSPIRIHLNAVNERIPKESRVNYSRLVTIEHNVKVFFIGHILPDDFDSVMDAVDTCWDNKDRRVHERRSN